MPSRAWFKIYAENWLEGTLRFETPEFRGVWADLLALTAKGAYADTGEIKIMDQVGFSDANFARILGVSRRKWSVFKLKLQTSGRISVNKNNTLTVINWKRYQSEYIRQKPYRKLQLKLHPKVTDEVTQEIEIEIETPPTPPPHGSVNKPFDTFWTAYPKKKSKGSAERAFFKIKPNKQLLATMLATIERAKKSGDWLKEDGKYIPHPATWLNGKGWEDEFRDESKEVSPDWSGR